jgi:long-subunit acyl-CoA synthetase (AMP-forming)
MGSRSAAAAADSARVGSVADNFAAVFQATVARVHDRPALRTTADETCLTWAQYASAVERTAGALDGLGVGRGDRVALLSRNRPELAIADVAAIHLGASTVALYVAATPRALQYVLLDCRPRILIVEQALYPRLAGVSHEVPHVVSLETLASRLASPRFDFGRAWRSVHGEDDLAVLYTSGTTGQLKGVRWRHREAINAMRRFDLLQPEPDGIRDISGGPFAHLTERGAGHWRSLLRGSTRTFCPDPTQLPATLLDARPTYLFGPPRLWQNLRDQLNSTLDESERTALDRAMAPFRVAHRPPTADEEPALAPLLARVGLDRVTRALTAAAPCPRGLFAYFHALGLGLGEFYGMTETSAATMTRPGTSDLATVGVPIPGYDIRLAADGEVLVRSDSTAAGYHNLPEQSAATFAADGWVHTGDIGALGEHGRLRIIDRKKEILIPDHGHNVAPGPIESELRSACPSIAHACLIGDRRPHVAALIVLQPPELAHDQHARSQVEQAISHINADLDPRQQIKSHAILPEPWSPGDELTETLKLRRHHILNKYEHTINQLYGRTTVTTKEQA